MTSSAVQDGQNVSAAEGSQVKVDFQTLLAGAGVYALDKRAHLSLTGSDRTRWLNGMVTNNIRDLASGSGVYAFLLNPQGHILGDLYAFNRGQSLAVETGSSQLEKVRSTFDRYIIMDDVEVEDLSAKLATIGISGPDSGSVLAKASFTIPALDMLQFADLTWRDVPVTIVRTDNPLVESYELWLAPEIAQPAQKALIEAGAKSVSGPALELLRVVSGLPAYGQDVRERDLPQETEQQRALHFSKGCYVGQEIVERIRSRGAVHRKFSGFEVQGELPSPGAKIQSDGKDVGEITSLAVLPTTTGERRVALGYIRREAALPGKVLAAGNAELSIAALPFANLRGDTNH